jgi:predicted HTH domain antitoxin
MSLVISDEIIRASGLSESGLLLEIVILLFQQDKVSLGKASEILGMSQMSFQRLLSERDIGIHYDMMWLNFKKTYACFHYSQYC